MSITDRIDLAILELLQVDASRPARSVADEIGLSTAATQRRINRLRDSGAIRSITANVEPAAVGLDTTCVVSVHLERDGSSVVDRLKESFRAEPRVQQAYYVTGTSDFVLVVVTATMAEYEAFTREFFLDDPDIQSFTTQVVLDAVDTGRALPLTTL